MEFNDKNFEEEVIKFEKGPVLVDFYAPWCGPCQMQGPIIDALASELEGQDLKIGKVNVDESPETAKKYNVMSIPTLVIIKNGEVVDTMMGLQNPEVLKEKLDSFK